METELLKIFDDESNHIGEATREEVHRIGFWHEVFHCWFVSQEEDRQYIYLQLRSSKKKDYPNLYDITAAGHILANESVHDGIREVEEELGIKVTKEELISLGLLKYNVTKGAFIDKEIANVFLHIGNVSMDDFNLQKEEVSGIVKADFADFIQLWFYEIDEINIKGIEVDNNENIVIIEKYIKRNDFVPHETSFYQEVIQLIKRSL